MSAAMIVSASILFFLGLGKAPNRASKK
jgi:hypothetical protein